MNTTAIQLKVAKAPAYVWRVNSLGMGETHNHIPCWYVVDAEHYVIAGGYHSGNNSRSGYAYLPRKKDAIAFAQGFHWAQAHLPLLSRNHRGDLICIDNPYRHELNKKSFDSDLMTQFEEGAVTAYEMLVECKHVRYPKRSYERVFDTHYTV